MCYRFFEVLSISIRTFSQLSRWYLFSLSIKTSGLMTFLFEIDSIASCSLLHRRGRHRRRSPSNCLCLFPIERKLLIFSDWLDDREYRLRFYAEHVFCTLSAFCCCDFLRCTERMFMKFLWICSFGERSFYMSRIHQFPFHNKLSDEWALRWWILYGTLRNDEKQILK